MNGLNGHSVVTNEELDALRVQEILDKAVTGTLVVILKWFKVSREYIALWMLQSAKSTMQTY